MDTKESLNSLRRLAAPSDASVSSKAIRKSRRTTERPVVCDNSFFDVGYFRWRLGKPI